MFNTSQRLGFSRRLLEMRSIVNRVHAYWSPDDMQALPAAKDYYKFVPERRPHPSRLYWRTVHPCQRLAYYSHSFPLRKRVRVITEAWSVKIERHSPRAMRNSSETRL